MKHVARIQTEFLKQSQAIASHRVLGKTGLEVFPFGLGGQALLEQEQLGDDPVKMIQRALNSGVNYYDTAIMYGPSRKYYGAALKQLGDNRKGIILASKVDKRDYKGAKEQLDETFELLGTDYIDIMQLHSMEEKSDLKALGKDGALQVLIEAQKAGKVKFIGFTGHSNPELQLEIMDEYDWDTVLLPINPAVTEFNKVAIKARIKDMGVIAMKVMARGILPRVVSASQLLTYAMEKADVAIVGCSSTCDVDQNASIARRYYNSTSSYINLDDDVKEGSRFFMKDSEARWPSTFQPSFPELVYD